MEINSTFHRPHRASTFARWAASVPAGFRFALKMPKTITREPAPGTRSLVESFLAGLDPLGTATDCLLVQLPPKLDLEADPRNPSSPSCASMPPSIALEPRHASWFAPAGDGCSQELRIARVAASPPRAPAPVNRAGGLASSTTGCTAPRACITRRTTRTSWMHSPSAWRKERRGIVGWCIFDNTTLGAGTLNALDLLERPGVS